jgi:endonuclease/exonuclease/phosphatase family metal-dependent hydrolase
MLMNPFTAYSQANDRINVLNQKEDSRGLPEVVLCSQNLENFGELALMKRREEVETEEERAAKMTALIQRFHKAGCTIIAVQEVLGANEKKAQEALNELAARLQFFTNKKYVTYVGPSNDRISRVGFIVEEEGIEFNGVTSFANVELPKISESQEPRLFARGPLQLRFVITGKEQSATRELTVITFHFKSQAFNSADGADLSWETYRMEMAEALRRIVVQRNEDLLKGDGNLLVLLGDRNSNFDTASARLLTGELILSRFQGEAPCRLNKRGMPLCKPGAALPPILTSVLTNDPQTFQTPGTYLYGNTFSWLDEILLPVTNLQFAYERPGIEGDYDSGVIREFPEASDHGLVYLKLNW